MMNPNKWVETLPNKKITSEGEKFESNPDKWVNTLPKVNNKSPIKKYTLTATIFIIGLILVSIIKNETRNLQKEINNLKASIDIIKLNLHETTLEHEVITSPENISRLAKEHLEFDLENYKKSQIKKLDKKEKKLAKLEDNKNYLKTNKKLINNMQSIVSNNMQSIVKEKIRQKKTELRKLQQLYSKPEELPEEVKLTISKKIKEKKDEIKKIYSNPKEYITFGKVQKWAGVQIVKVFLGIPIMPGK